MKSIHYLSKSLLCMSTLEMVRGTVPIFQPINLSYLFRQNLYQNLGTTLIYLSTHYRGKFFTGSTNSFPVCFTQRYSIVDYIGASLFAQKILLLSHKSNEFQCQLVYFNKYLAIFFVIVFLLSQFSVPYSKPFRRVQKGCHLQNILHAKNS